jgi:tyrosine-protein kinase Etk/Wzc
LGFDKYAWGGELVQVDSLDVPRRVEDKALVLHFVGDGAYKLFDSEGEFVLGEMWDKEVVRAGARFIFRN